jgi:hypothetical protein
MYYIISDVALGGSCQGGVDNECSDPNAECISSKCTCKVGYYRFYEGNSQSNCRAGKLNFNYLLVRKAIVVTTLLFI